MPTAGRELPLESQACYLCTRVAVVMTRFWLGFCQTVLDVTLHWSDGLRAAPL